MSDPVEEKDERVEQQFLPIYRRKVEKPVVDLTRRWGDLNYQLMKDICPHRNNDHLCQLSVDDPDHKSFPCTGTWYKSCTVYMKNRDV